MKFENLMEIFKGENDDGEYYLEMIFITSCLLAWFAVEK